MKACMGLLVLLLLTVSPLRSLAGSGPDCIRECLICAALSDPEQYTEGTMKSMEMIVPGRDNWLFRSSFDLAETFGIPPDSLASFRELVSKLQSRGISLAIVVQPTRGLMHVDKVIQARAPFNHARARASLARFLDQLRQNGVITPDILTLVDEPPAEDYFFRRDHHWTPAGARATARVAAGAIRQTPVHASLTSKAYVTAKSIIIPKDGTMNTALKHVCGNNFGMQFVQGYQTVPAANDASALFGEASAPEVVLLGTSNSANREDERKTFNFAGFLQEYLAIEILNYGLQGSGQDGSFIQYLHSPDYDPSNPPKLIIWELPANYRLDDPLMYRQLIPALSGQCTADRARLSQTTPLPAQPDAEDENRRRRVEVLSNTGRNRAELTGFEGYLDLRFSDPALKEFYVIVYYDNGERDKVWYRRPGIVNGGQYFLSLSRAPQHRSANVLSVFVEPTQAVTAASTLELKLCD